MTDDDLRKSLTEIAVEAPDVSTLDTAQLVQRIDHRRSRRAVALIASSAAVVAAVSVGLYFGGQQVIRPDAPVAERADASAQAARGDLVIGKCGELVTGKAGDKPPIAMTANLPAPVRRDDRGSVTFEVTLTNQTDTAVRVLTTKAPQVYVTRDRLIVAGSGGVRAAGYVIELQPRQSTTLRAAASFKACGGATAGDDLAAGSYELFARMQVTPIDGNGTPTGESYELGAGPWQVSVV